MKIRVFARLVYTTVATFACVGSACAQIHVDEARIGCLDMQKDGNLTGLVGGACNGKFSCSYKAPTPTEYTRAGVRAAGRSFCTQAMEITYHCGTNASPKWVQVPGDAWTKPPGQLACDPPPPPPGSVSDPITVTKARIGCLAIQRDANLTGLVAAACNGRASCSYKAPTPDEYTRAGVRAAGRQFCTQGMEISFRCGHNDEETVEVPGDAWNHDAAQLSCGGHTVASNCKYVTPSNSPCTPAKLGPPDYIVAPSNMLDWTPNPSHGDYTFLGFRPTQPPTPPMYNSSPDGGVPGAPGSTLGANEGRVRADLRAAAARKDPLQSLCQAAQAFTKNLPASPATPSGQELGNAFADLSVTGKASFERFKQLHPNEASLRSNPACAGASPDSITKALNRAYAVANALRGPHDAPARQSLGWIAVSGEDDQPYRPVNVPTNKGKFPEFQLTVMVPKFNIPVNTRYVISHLRPPAFMKPATPLVDGGPGRQVAVDFLPALASDAKVILFIHGMDSRLEEADDITAALHRLGGQNWTVIAVDFPTSGYADNINHQRISPITAVACHKTPLLDFMEEFFVAFVDTLDAQLHGQLKPKIVTVAGGSFGGNMTMRLGRRPNTPWIPTVIPWSPAAIWPSMIAEHGVMAGCDTGWDGGKDRGVNQALKWAGLETRFLPEHETPELRRELFYGGFDWDGGELVAIFSGNNHKPQAACWFSDGYPCKKHSILAARIDRQETYDANFRAMHWRMGAEQLVFSQQQFVPGTHDPLYLHNNKRMLLLTGTEDVCADLGKYTREVASKMVNTPGYARFLEHTGHSLDNEHPDWVARQIVDFLAQK